MTDAEDKFAGLIACESARAAKRYYADHYPSREPWPFLSPEMVREGLKRHLDHFSRHSTGPQRELRAGRWDCRFRYSKLPPSQLQTTQNLVQPMATGLTYEFQGDSPILKFEVYVRFEGEGGSCYEPYLVPDAGEARATFATRAAVGFHRMLMEDEEPFYICDAVARRIAKCELIEFGSHPA